MCVLEGACRCTEVRNSHYIMVDVLCCVSIYVLVHRSASALHTCFLVYRMGGMVVIFQVRVEYIAFVTGSSVVVVLCHAVDYGFIIR